MPDTSLLGSAPAAAARTAPTAAPTRARARRRRRPPTPPAAFAQDSDELVALEACEFWSAICETRVAKEYLADYLPRLVPVLLDGMVYTEFDLLVLGADDDEDEAVADRPEDIKPHFHKGKLAGAQGAAEGGAAACGAGGAGGAGAGGSGGGEDDEDEDESDDDLDSDALEWNLRKCSASGLDIVAGLFGRDILPPLLPLLQAKLSDGRWEVRESAILALGAVADGCMEHMADHLPQLVPWLIQTLADVRPLIRSICCWTLSRYAKWLIQTPPAELHFQPLLQELLKRVLDNNKRVQEAACSAFATVEEEAGELLVPYLGPVLQNLMFAFSKYQARPDQRAERDMPRGRGHEGAARATRPAPVSLTRRAAPPLRAPLSRPRTC